MVNHCCVIALNSAVVSSTPSQEPVTNQLSPVGKAAIIVVMVLFLSVAVIIVLVFCLNKRRRNKRQELNMLNCIQHIQHCVINVTFLGVRLLPNRNSYSLKQRSHSNTKATIEIT